MSEARDQGLLRWVPTGLLIAATLAVGRTLGLIAAAERGLPGIGPREREILRWENVGALPEQLVQGLVLGLVAAALANGALRTGQGLGRLLGPFAFVLVVLSMGLTGWPLDPPALQAGRVGRFAFDDVTTCLGFAALLTLFLFGSLVGARSGHGLLVSGPLGLVLGLVALAAPLWISFRRGADAPTFERRVVVRELLADDGAWRVLAAPAGAPPRVEVLTPDVQNHTDSADRPALVLAPGSRVAFTVPEDDGSVRLRAAAGIDQRLRPWLIQSGLERVDVDLGLTVNGEERFRARVPVQGTWDPREYAAGAFVWHHVGGGEGLPLQPGDEVELSVRLPEDSPLAGRVPAELRAGFGPLVLEQAVTVERSEARREAPNILMVVMDTQRADRLSCYGHDRPTTPHLDDLAARGVLFEDAWSTASWTWPATASLLTGLPPHAHGVLSNAACNLNLSLDTLPEVLQERGYTTGAFSCNPLIAAERSFDQGFESFDHDRAAFRMSDEVAPDVLRWLRAHRGVRFFLYLHLADPHTPHRPHPEEVARLGFTAPADFPGIDEHGRDGMDQYTARLRGDRTGRGPEELIPAAHRRWIDEQYDASVATGDRWLGVILDELEELGLAETTVVAFTSDHGEELFDHGGLEHGHTLYSELVHVPLIVAGPGIPRGVRVPGVVSNRHLAPTLARLGGTELSDVESFGMRFLLDGSLLSGEDTGGRALFQTAKGDWDGARAQDLLGLREGRWTLHWRRDGSPEREDLRLFDVQADADQTLDRMDAEPTTGAELLAELQAALAQQEAWAPDHVVGAGAQTVRMLQGIGYLPGQEEADEDGVAPDGGARSGGR